VPAEQVYKNLQVLKGVPSDQLIPAMQFITASLGVECGFCHVENHFDQDDKKPKQTARKMMQMMMAINQNHFENHLAVTCNTCHHGSRVPVSIPLVSEGSPRLHLPAGGEDRLPPNLPSPDQVLEKYVTVLGGAQTIQKLNAVVEKGAADFAGRQVSVDVFAQSPDKRFFAMHLPDGDSVTVVNGHEGWSAAPRRPVHPMSGGELSGARLDADLQLALHLKQAFGALRAAPPERIDDRDCYVLIGETSSQPRARLYFDQQTGLLNRVVYYAETPLGLNPTRVDYADYRAVNGVQMPYRWTLARPAGQFTVQLSEITANVPIAAEKFSKPAGNQPPAP
jgi:hypothetical protein